MSPVASGSLRHRVDVYRPDEVPDGQGGYQPAGASSHVFSYSAWARVEPVLASQKSEPLAHDLIGAVSHRVTLRPRSDIQIASRWRILFGGRKLEVVGAPVEDVTGEIVTLRCREIR